MQSPLREWLSLQCQLIPGTEAALAFLGASEHAAGAEVAHWPSRDQRSPRLAATVEAAHRHGRLVAQQPPDMHGPQAAIPLALPLLLADRVVGAVGLCVRGVAPGEIKAVADRLGSGVRGFELLLQAHTRQDRLDTLLGLAGSLLDHDQLAEASHALAAELAQRTGSDRVAVGLRRGKRIRVCAMSTSLRFAEESDAVRDLAAAMGEAVEQDAVIELPPATAAAPQVPRYHELLARSSGAGAICTLPLVAMGRPVGAVTCEWSSSDALDASRRVLLQDAGALCGPILELLSRAEAGLLERARARLARFGERHLGADRALAKAVLASAAALLVFLAFAPGDYRVSARATLEGRVQRALVAPVNGYLAEANARAGDIVSAGDVLARLDDRDLQLEHRKWESQRAQLEKEYREALAERDRTRVSILRAQIDQASAQLELSQEQLLRTSVVAPFDGVVLEGELERSLGSPVEQGIVLFELAPLDGYRIIVEVDERDIADVAEGQRGRLALSALPDRPLDLVVERITPISTAEDGRNFFRVQAALAEPDAALRPGMEGVAKVEVGRRRLLWIWTHELLDWLRLAAWSFLP